MRQPINISTFLFLVAWAAMFSCEQHQDRKQSNNSNEAVTKEAASKDSVFKNGNLTTTISSDIGKLEQILDLKTYKPTKVKFKYTFIDNSGENQRLSVPGPSDYSLQAILYFDSLTFEKFLDDDKNADYPSPNYNKDVFKFDWLDQEIMEELNNSKENYHSHPDFFFGITNSKAWYLDKKILISKWTN